MKRTTLMMLMLCAPLASIALIAGTADQQPMKNSGAARDIKWASAKAAKSKYDGAEQSGLAEYERTIGAARDQLQRDLRASLKEATRVENLDEAVKIRAVVDSLKQAKLSAPGDAALQ